MKLSELPLKRRIDLALLGQEEITCDLIQEVRLARMDDWADELLRVYHDKLALGREEDLKIMEMVKNMSKREEVKFQEVLE